MRLKTITDALADNPIARYRFTRYVRKHREWIEDMPRIAEIQGARNDYIRRTRHGEVA